MTTPTKQPIPFGKYVLLDRIAIGGMAEVWRGKGSGIGGGERLIAIKRILPNIAEDDEFVRMFIDEAKISVQLMHPNIAQTHDLGQINNSYFIAMEYIPGKDLRTMFDRCKRDGTPAPVEWSCYVIAKLCEGLDYAHRRKDTQGREMNIIHRDISPQNVLISYDGEVKIIDFGIAKAAGKATRTQAGVLKGKFGYMSPEQIRGLPMDRRSDIFAIGVCLHEMLTGERLFTGDSDFTVLEKVRRADVAPPSNRNRLVPHELDRLVLKAVARDAENRYTFASELGSALQQWLSSAHPAFGRKDVAQFVRGAFPDDAEQEAARVVAWKDVTAPGGSLPSPNSPPPPPQQPPAPPPHSLLAEMPSAVSLGGEPPTQLGPGGRPGGGEDHVPALLSRPVIELNRAHSPPAPLPRGAPVRRLESRGAAPTTGGRVWRVGIASILGMLFGFGGGGLLLRQLLKEPPAPVATTGRLVVVTEPERAGVQFGDRVIKREGERGFEAFDVPLDKALEIRVTLAGYSSVVDRFLVTDATKPLVRYVKLIPARKPSEETRGEAP
ncbi:MAG: serine/threonine protein kinase [Myxococcaceae bacterium]